MNEYFIARNGEKIGPFSLDGLRNQGLRRNDLVWSKGMPDWARAHTIPELTSILPSAQTPPPQQQSFQSNYSGTATHTPEKRSPKLVGLLVLSILGIIGSLIQIGFGIVFSTQRSWSYWNDGDCWYTESKLDSAYSTGGGFAIVFGIFLLILSILGIVGSYRSSRFKP